MVARSLSLVNVVKSYGSLAPAVDNVSLTVAPGEFVAFLGPSGSGKTTTLMMVAGFQEPTSGDILVDGKDIAHTPAHKRNIGMVFQSYALFPHMSVSDNVWFPLRMRGIARTAARKDIDRALNLVGLDGYGARLPKDLSGGQQQRVALARALVFQPDVILLDEPLGALDKSLREHMQVELKRIQKELGVTMIYVTHDQGEAMAMADRIAVFNKGRVEQIATPLELYNRPQTEFVAGFVGDSNLFRGRVSTQENTVELEGIGKIEARISGAAGSAVHALIRPENIRRALPSDTSAKPMTISSLVHYGDLTLATGTVAGQPVRMKLLGREAVGLAEGSQCPIVWTPADVHLVAAR